MKTSASISEHLPRDPASPQQGVDQPLDKGQGLHWYAQMQRIRKFEEKADQLYGQQRIKGFCHLYNGQEACVVGAVSAARPEDKHITAYRDHAHPLALGTPSKLVMAELLGKASGLCKGRGGSMHMFDRQRNLFGGHGIVGAQIPLGVGIAFAEKYRKTNHVCLTYMGDGAVRQGAFHESLNLAMLYALPIVFLIENNGYAMGTSVERSSNVVELYRLGAAYHMRSLAVDAMSVAHVHQAVAQAIALARSGQPSLLELNTYRYKGHSVSDPATYRKREEIVERKKRDPILLLKTHLLEQHIATESELQAIDQKIKNEIEEAVAFAEASEAPSQQSLYQEVYAQADYAFLHS